MAKEWTLMYYMAGDNDLADAVTAKLADLRRIGSTNDADVVAQFDLPGNGPLQRALIPGQGQESRDLPPARASNSGDGRTLTDFITFAKSKFRSQRSMLVIYNHGSGLDVDPPNHRNHGVAPPESVLQMAANGGDDVNADAQTLRRRLRKEAPRLRSLFPKPALERVESIMELQSSAGENNDAAPLDITVTAIGFDTPTGDFIDNLELRDALGNALHIGRQRDRFDVLGFEACLMNTFEIAYQLRTVARYIVGSQSLIPRAGWPYADIIRSLHPSVENAVLARKIVGAGANGIVGDDYITMSALDLSKANEVAKAISVLANEMTEWLEDDAVFQAIALAHYSAQSFEESETVDLIDFCRQLTKRVDDAGIRAAAFALENAASKFVLESQTRGQVVSNASGISIFLPKRRNIPNVYRELQFANATTWTAFLDPYLQKLFPTDEEAQAAAASAVNESESPCPKETDVAA